MRHGLRNWWGIIILIVGILLLVQQTNFLSTYGISIAMLWGVTFSFCAAVMGIIFLLRGGYWYGIIAILFAIAIILQIFFVINLFIYFWPIIVILVGLGIIFRGERIPHFHHYRSYYKDQCNESMQSDSLEETITFGVAHKKVYAKNFNGGKISCIFGHGVYDLSGITVASTGATIHIDVSFGSVKVIVPQHSKIQSLGTPLYGSWQNYTSGTDGPTLSISGSAFCGEVVISAA